MADEDGNPSVPPEQTEGARDDLKPSTSDEGKADSASAPDKKMLNLLIFGATGRVGKQLLKQALALGHRVTVVVRSPENIDPEDIEKENLEVQKGNACDRNSFSSYLAGKDAVVSALGTKGYPWKTITLYSRSITEIHEAMKSNGVTRFVGMTGWGIKPNEPSAPFLARKIFLPLFMGRYSEDTLRMEAYLRETELNFTIVRPPGLTQAAMSDKEYIVEEESSWIANAAISMPIANIAKFMLNCLQTTEYDKKIIGVGLQK